jgi:predicted nucleic acid-binding protein
VRRLPECVTAVVAMRHDVALLHADRGFDVIARYAPLRIAG